jgi:glycosyltransferase involved in cell wall biosynthesis
LGVLAHRVRKAGIRVLQVVHNVSDHEASSLKRLATGYQLSKADAFITHNRELARELDQRPDRIPIAVHPHPIFENYPPVPEPTERKAELDLLFFGIIRRYKGLDIALDALSRVRRKAHLTIVGECWEDEAAIRERIRNLGLSERIEFVPRYVSDLEAARYFAAADVVLLPYRDVSGSGVIPVAYHFGKPVIVTRLPGLTEVVRNGRTGWVVAPEDPAATAALIDREVTRDRAVAMRPEIERLRAEMSWHSFCEALLRLAEPAESGGRAAHEPRDEAEILPADTAGGEQHRGRGEHNDGR